MKNLMTEKANKTMFFLLIVLMFSVIFFLNVKTPLIADDYVYTFIFGSTTKITSIFEIIQSQWIYYMTWGGRVLAESLTQLFMFWGKDIFNSANSLCYIVFILALYFNAVGRKIKAEILLLTMIVSWFFLPMFGQTVMWLTGACNYLWCATFILLALLPFRFYEESQTKFLSGFLFGILMIPLFFLSGSTNENTAGGMILIMLLFCLVYYKRKIKIPIFAYTGLFFSMTGFFCMIFAPGNAMRAGNESAVAEVTAMVGSNPIITRLAYFAYNLYDLMPLIIVAALILLILYRCKGKKALVIDGIFVLAAGASLLVMLAPPKFPPRAMFGLATFLIIAIIYAVDQLKISPVQIKKNFLPMACVLIYFVMSLGYAGMDAITVSKQYEQRLLKIEAERGAETILLPGILPISKHNGMYGLKDIQSDPNHWVNRAIADYYGVSNISLKD